MNWLPRITELSRQVENGATGGFSAMQQLVAEVEAASSTYAEECRRLLRDARSVLDYWRKLQTSVTSERVREVLIPAIDAALATTRAEIGHPQPARQAVEEAFAKAREVVRPIVEAEAESAYPTSETANMRFQSHAVAPQGDSFNAAQVRYSEILTAAREAGKRPYDPALNPLFDAIYGAEPIFASMANPVLAVGTGNADTARLNWLDEMWLPMEIAPGQVENRARWWSDKLHLTIREAVDAAMPPQTIPSQGIVKSDGPEA